MAFVFAFIGPTELKFLELEPAARSEGFLLLNLLIKDIILYDNLLNIITRLDGHGCVHENSFDLKIKTDAFLNLILLDRRIQM